MKLPGFRSMLACAWLLALTIWTTGVGDASLRTLDSQTRQATWGGQVTCTPLQFNCIKTNVDCPDPNGFPSDCERVGNTLTCKMCSQTVMVWTNCMAKGDAAYSCGVLIKRMSR
jgi:hypothetical protein